MKLTKRELIKEEIDWEKKLSEELYPKETEWDKKYEEMWRAEVRNNYA
jgi:hypothetical protein